MNGFKKIAKVLLLCGAILFLGDFSIREWHLWDFFGGGDWRIWMGIFIGLLSAVLGFCFTGNRSSKSKKNPFEKHKANRKDNFFPDNPENNHNKNNAAELIDVNAIVKFFLDIFRRQLRADENAPVQFRVTSSGVDSLSQFELRVMVQGRWSSRFITITSIGEDSGARSRCFHVIYDDHLVIKVPPSPIADFKAYYSRIEEDRRIASELSPLPCVIPGVSHILKRTHPLSDVDKLNAEEREKQYVSWLRFKEQYQTELKILNSYVFFMDLSTNQFLDGVLRDLHNIDAFVQREIKNHGNLILDVLGFQQRYGDVSTAPTILYNSYNLFLEHMNSWADKSGTSYNSFSHLLKTAFVFRITGQPLSHHLRSAPENLCSEIQAKLNDLYTEHESVCGQYREAIHAFVKQRSSNQLKPQFRGIVEHLLGLLPSLYERKIAIRDLKPDNLFVAGPVNDYPEFLKKPEQYNLGFIDFETAVSWQGVEGGDIPQPRLGGTPYYATPSHLYSNAVIGKLYPEISDIFLMQDWHAVIAMIFKVVTGSHLFSQSSKQMPAMNKMLATYAPGRKLLVDNDDLKKIAQVNSQFWDQASTEFNQKMKLYMNQLKALGIALPGPTRALFLNDISMDIDVCVKDVEQLVAGQSVFTAEKNRQWLLHATVGRIQKTIEQLNHDAAGNRDKIGLLAEIKKIKIRQEGLSANHGVLARNDVPVPLCGVLEFMFQRVYRKMQC